MSPLSSRYALVGSAHPVVIDTHNRLIAGQRRIRAHLFLGIVKIPVTVVNLDEIVRGEYAENAIRKNFGLKEVFAIYEAAGPIEIAAAKERQLATLKRGKAKPPVGDVDANGRRGLRAVDKVGQFAGVSGRTLERVIAVMTAARAEPDNELYAKLVEDMDRTGKANGAVPLAARARRPERFKPAPGAEIAPTPFERTTSPR